MQCAVEVYDTFILNQSKLMVKNHWIGIGSNDSSPTKKCRNVGKVLLNVPTFLFHINSVTGTLYS